jgi:glycosyltransferase involved in cell wall biosynthesis
VTVDVPTLDSLPAPPPGRSAWPWTEAPPPLPPRRPDGSAWPRISIVTGSHNQGAYLEETLRSVLLQGYPNLEYIVVDGGSSDDSPHIIRRYARWLACWEAQPDRGQAAALNYGFGRATGAILGFLNSDDTYLPGALERAAREVDVERNRHLVIGRCLFVDAAGRWLGNEHPSRAVSHRRLLAVWKGHTIPQPASFWSRAAWSDGGPLVEDAGAPWIDYGLFCRMTRRRRIHAVDQVLATYRLHSESITMAKRGNAGEETLRISRRYWGPAWTLRHLALACSLAVHRFDRLGRARDAVRRGRERRARGRPWRAFASTLAALLGAPDLLFQLAVERCGSGRLQRWLAELAAAVGRQGSAARREQTEPWHDRWVGPHLRLDLDAIGGERRLRLEGTMPDRADLGAPLRLLVRVDGIAAGKARIDHDGPFAVEMALPAPAAPGRCRVEIEAAPCFVPDTILGNGDTRRLCWLMQSVDLRP